jgi:hypothetical protein
MARFGHVLKAERGRDKVFPSAYDGVVHFSLQLLEGITLPNFLAIREEGRSLLNVANISRICIRRFASGVVSWPTWANIVGLQCGQLQTRGQFGPSWMFQPFGLSPPWG